MDDQRQEPLTPVSYRPRGVWEMLLGVLVGFWVIFGVNAFLIFLFMKPDSPSSSLAALASIGEILLVATVSLEDMIGALLARAGITRKTSN